MDKINQLLVNTFKVSEGEVTKDLTMDDINSWDSLSHMNLIVNIEETFSIELTGDEIADMISFDEIRRIVSNHTQGL